MQRYLDTKKRNETITLIRLCFAVWSALIVYDTHDKMGELLRRYTWLLA